MGVNDGEVVRNVPFIANFALVLRLEVLLIFVPTLLLTAETSFPNVNDEVLSSNVELVDVIVSASALKYCISR